MSSPRHALAHAVALTLLPVTVFAQSSSAAAGLAGASARCDPADVLTARCEPAGAVRPAVSGFAMERARWRVPGLPEAGADANRASYPFDAGWVRVVPSVVVVPGAYPATPGVVSVGLERAAADEPVRLRGEVGWSGRPRGSFELDYRAAGRQASLRADERPAGVVALPDARAPGSTWDGRWQESFGPRTDAIVALSNDRLALHGREPGVTAGHIRLLHRPSGAWNVSASLGSTSYADALHPGLRRGVASLGTELQLGAFHVGATWRDEFNSLADGWGRGGRVTLRHSLGGWQASVFADAQQHAASIELHGYQPDLPSGLVDLGLAGASPERAVRMLRDRGLLLEQNGIELGALRVDPLRVQGGVDVKWRAAGPRRTEVGLLLAMDDMQGTDDPRRARLGQVRMSWRAFGDADLSASYANWSLQGDAQAGSQSLFRVWLRSSL